MKMFGAHLFILIFIKNIEINIKHIIGMMYGSMLYETHGRCLMYILNIFETGNRIVSVCPTL